MLSISGDDEHTFVMVEDSLWNDLGLLGGRCRSGDKGGLRKVVELSNSGDEEAFIMDADDDDNF